MLIAQENCGIYRVNITLQLQYQTRGDSRSTASLGLITRFILTLNATESNATIRGLRH